MHRLRQHDGEDHVVEAEVGRSGGRHRAARAVDDQVGRVDAQLAEHGAEQRHLVLAVAVAMREHLGSGARLQAADAEFDRDVADVVLHEARHRAHLVEQLRARGGELGDLLPDLGRGLAAAARQLQVPGTHVLPAAQRRRPARGRERDPQAPGDLLPRRHARLLAQRAHVVHHPLQAAAGGLRRLLGVVEPGGVVLPAGRQLDAVARFAHRHGVLEHPFVGQQVRLELALELVADDAAGYGGRDLQHARAHVGDQFAVGDAAERRLVGVAVPDLVALARGGDAPGVQVGDAAAGREWHEHGAALGTLAAQDPVDAPVHALEPAVGLGIQPRLAVEHHGRGLVVVRRQHRTHLRLHPGGRARRRRGRRAAAPRTPGRARRSGRA